MRPLDGAAALAVIVIWGLNFVVGKIGVGQIPPLMLMSLRFALVAALLSPFLRRPGRSWRPVIAVSVVLGGLHFGLLFTGLRGVDAGPAAIALQLTAPFSAILAAVFYRERLGPLQILGMAVAFAGVALLAGAPSTATSLAHLSLVVLAALAWAYANILIKRLGGINVFVLNAWVALLALPQLFAASLWLEEGQLAAMAAADWRGWGAIVYMAVGASITAYGLWYYLIAKYEVNRIVPLTLLSPVLAVVFAIAILDEPLTVRIVVGGLVTIAGVAMIQFLRPSAPPAAGQPS
ncbi:MAG: DMT family transporter [Rhodospirillales bacterium]